MFLRKRVTLVPEKKKVLSRESPSVVLAKSRVNVKPWPLPTTVMWYVLPDENWLKAPGTPR